MRRLACLLLSMLMLCTAALADGFDQTRLEQTKDYTTYMDIHQVNTIVAPPGQPWMGETELEDSEVAVYLDFIQMPDDDMTFLRLTLSLTSYEFVAAGELTITVGGKDYVFDVFPAVVNNLDCFWINSVNFRNLLSAEIADCDYFFCMFCRMTIHKAHICLYKSVLFSGKIIRIKFCINIMYKYNSRSEKRRNVCKIQRTKLIFCCISAEFCSFLSFAQFLYSEILVEI